MSHKPPRFPLRAQYFVARARLSRFLRRVIRLGISLLLINIGAASLRAATYYYDAGLAGTENAGSGTWDTPYNNLGGFQRRLCRLVGGAGRHRHLVGAR